MVKISSGKFEIDLFNEAINTRMNVEAILTLLAKKGIITEKEFFDFKKKLIEKFKKDNPDLFKKEKGVNKKID